MTEQLFPYPTLFRAAHPADIGLALGDGDHPARVQQVEQMASLDRLVIGRQRQFRGQQFLALFLRLAELVEQEIGARMLEIIGRELLLALKERSEEHTSELQSLMRISYAVFCLT